LDTLTGQSKPPRLPGRLLNQLIVIRTAFPAGAGGICAVIMFFLFMGNVQAQNGTQLKLVWDEEFNQPDGSSPDPAKWDYDLGSNGINSELEYYTSRTNNARIVNGQLVIEADHESYSGASYTSARLKTQGKWSWAYGRIEARIKIPRGQGIWPAFWTLGDNINSVGWPACGEIDILENIGNSNNLGIAYGTIHGPVSGSGDYKGGAGVQGRYALPGGAALADDFHVYAVQWTTNQIQWFVDTNLYFTATPASLPSGGTWIFTQPQFLVLNVAVGGTWPGNPDGTTVFPQKMLVDYVRVYQQTTPVQITVAQSYGDAVLSGPTNIVCHLQTQTNSLMGRSWFDPTNTTNPLVVSPDPNNACVYFRLESP
jgi:beta-glucanase (GH16 family)